jgi:hypothetical protein
MVMNFKIAADQKIKSAIFDAPGVWSQRITAKLCHSHKEKRYDRLINRLKKKYKGKMFLVN